MKHMAHPQAELGLSHICPLWDPNCNSVFMLNIHHFIKYTVITVNCDRQISECVPTYQQSAYLSDRK